MEKPSLDQLRIERTPEKESSGAGKYFLLGVVVLLLAAAGYYFGFRPADVAEIQTAVATKVSERSCVHGAQCLGLCDRETTGYCFVQVYR